MTNGISDGDLMRRERRRTRRIETGEPENLAPAAYVLTSHPGIQHTHQHRSTLRSRRAEAGKVGISSTVVLMFVPPAGMSWEENL